MLRWACLVLTVFIVVISVVEYVTHLTPLEQLLAVLGRGAASEAAVEAGGRPDVTIRVAVASWQLDEFPWEETVRKFEKAHGGKVRVTLSSIPDNIVNTMLLFWASGMTEYDVVVAWYDGEIQPLINYNFNSRDPARRGLVVNVRDYLTPEQVESLVPEMFVGSRRKNPDKPDEWNYYEVPWMGEVLAINYNKTFFRERGIGKVPTTWDEVEEVAKKLQGLQYDGHPVAPLALNFAQKSSFFAQNSYIPMLAAFKKGRGIYDEKGRLDVSSPEAAKVFETLKRYKDEGLVSPDCMTDVDQDLRARTAAIYFHWQSRGMWAVKDHGPEVIGIAPTPGASEAGALACTYGAVIPRCSPIKREAVQFAYEALSTDAYGFQSAVASGFMEKGKRKGGGKMPVLKEMYSLDKHLNPDIAELGRSLHKAYFYPDPVNWQIVSEILVVEFQKYLTGVTPTADEALKIVQRRFAEEVYAEK
jgi:ABC-type glycerol-3-phosphate transport system substrate-binding protein